MQIRKTANLILIFLILLTGCIGSGTTVKVVKPKRHFSAYKHKKHAKKKRIRTVRYKSLQP